MTKDLTKIIDICENTGWDVKDLGSSIIVSCSSEASKEASAFGLNDGLDYSTFISSDTTLASFAEKMEDVYMSARENSENWPGHYGDDGRKMFDEIIDKMENLSNALNDELSKTKGKKRDKDLER